jgi:hypothetical protein
MSLPVLLHHRWAKQGAAERKPPVGFFLTSAAWAIV